MIPVVWVEYVMSNAAWSLGGLLVGYSMGRTERSVEWLRRHFEKEERRG